MKHLFTLFLIITLSLPSFSQDKDELNTTTTYYFIRHAEKDRSDAANRDPHLTEAGKARAEKWSTIFNDVKFDAVYSTNYNRTKETAQPTADKNNLEITIYDPRVLNSETFEKETKGKTVLVVGHSNTTPAFVNSVLRARKYEDIDDNNNGNLYIVSIKNGEITDELKVFN